MEGLRIFKNIILIGIVEKYHCSDLKAFQCIRKLGGIDTKLDVAGGKTVANDAR